MTRPASGSSNVLWLLFLPLTVWGLHFLTAYVAAAVYCAKSSNMDAAIVAIRWIVVVATLLALGAIGASLWYGRRRIARETGSYSTAVESRPVGARPTGDARPASDRPSANESGAPGQARFGWTVLCAMCALGALAVIYVGGAAFFFGDCR
jgi:hypothetical protein